MNLKQLKILLVDDNPHMRLMLSQILRSVGILKIAEASDGSEALEVLRAQGADIVVTDLAMAPMDGIDFVRLLRNSSDSSSQMIPVVMVTGHLTLRSIQEARDAGVNEFVAKPITAKNVLERLQVVVDHPRQFVRTDGYFGPDRRRRQDSAYKGEFRRKADGPQPVAQGE